MAKRRQPLFGNKMLSRVHQSQIGNPLFPGYVIFA